MGDEAAAGETTLEGTVERVVFASEENGFRVVRLAVPGQAELVTAVGSLLEVQPGECLRLAGAWEEDRKFGRQFRARAFATLPPATGAAIERYLGSGLIRGIGQELARRLVARFGAETLEVIDRQPERLAEVPGIGPKRSAQVREAWQEQREIREVMLFLQAHGVGTSQALRIWKTYGAEALEVVREDPYRLARDVFGIGFATADQIAGRLGVPPDSPQRARAGVLHLLAEAADRGHLYLPRRLVESQGEGLLGAPRQAVAQAIADLAAGGEVVIEAPPAGDGAGGEEAAVYLPPLYAAEAGLAERLAALAAHPPSPLSIDLDRAFSWLASRQGLDLAVAQREAVRQALASKVLVITGGPGTGKTTLVRAIVELLGRKGRTVLLAAPTGRAAKRLAEATGAEARTVHRLLEWSPKARTFERGPDRPLAGDLLIVDEASMLDAPLAHALARALPDSAQLVLVGDVDQLPSVGPGSVLADLIASRAVAVVRLTEIFRQARESRIVVNAHRINRGEMPLLEGGESSDFFFIERREPEAVLETLLELVCRRIPSRFGLDPLADLQVLTPMNRGALGVASLNQALRERLNPHGREVVRGGRLLRLADKVMQVRNNYELDVFNGDLGRIVAIDAEQQLLSVAFDGREVGYDFADLDELVPAYACSIHKAQGSEYPCVVLPLHTQHYVMLDRNLLYTALTRARRLAVLVGEKRALAVAVGNQRTRRRFTRLAERLAKLMAR